jgi:hypothetical protein
MYKANVYRVMIASPGDVPQEREIARELINEWNTLHSSRHNIVLIPLLWEYNTAPASGQRAQGIINDQLLKHADLLVGIFWKRVGSSTGKAISGTVEELETHVSNGKPAMLYFSAAPLPQDFDREQYDALQKFKSEAQQNNLYASYGSIEDFKEKFRSHLALTINDSGFFGGFNEKSTAENMNVRSPNNSINFPEEAKILLYAMAKSTDGKLILSLSKTGTTIQIGNRNYVPEQTARVVARWKNGLEYLVGWGYVRPLSSSLFEITELGFQFSDGEIESVNKIPAIVIEDLVVEKSDAQFSGGMCRYYTNLVTIKIKNTGTKVIKDFSISIKLDKHLLSSDTQAEIDGEYGILNFNETNLYGGQIRSVKVPVKITDRFVKKVINTDLIVTVYSDDDNISREYPIKSFFKMSDVNQREVKLNETFFGNPYEI